VNWPVVIKNGPLLNQTLSCIKFDKFGAKINQPIFVCDQWEQGFTWAKEQGYSHALFVNSGTLFLDWAKWCDLVQTYPHSGLIAHLIWHPAQTLHANDQCWFAELSKFDVEDITATIVQYPALVRSEKNLHDDYTPLWVKPTVGNSLTTDVEYFGQGLIAKQLQHGPVVNWNNAARDLKVYLYNGVPDTSLFQEYKNISEHQLWVFNNEPVILVKKKKLLTPGSGLSWILNIVQPETNEIQIVDISDVQIEFCKRLWEHWDGTNYGNFVWEFIDSNKLNHYELDNPELTQLERLKLKGKSKFIEYVNSKFHSAVEQNFETQWCHAKQNKRVNFCKDNFITWVVNNDIGKFDDIWQSNILDYKWTLLHTTVAEYKQFEQKINENQNKQGNV